MISSLNAFVINWHSYRKSGAHYLSVNINPIHPLKTFLFILVSFFNSKEVIIKRWNTYCKVNTPSGFYQKVNYLIRTNYWTNC
jgi:hypothetical protein